MEPENKDTLRAAAEAALDVAYPAETGTLISFLVNALYLFGGQTVAAAGTPEGVTAELTRLGHGVRALPNREGRQGRPGAEGARGAGRQRSPEQADRVFLNEAFGREADPVARLRALRKALRPGGLLCFHAIDRDRAWERTGARAIRLDGGEVRARIDFDPATGRLIARAADGGPAASVGTWNLGELADLLRAAGLTLERAYGDWDGGAPGASGRIIVVAAKPRGRSKTVKAKRETAAMRRAA